MPFTRRTNMQYHFWQKRSYTELVTDFCYYTVVLSIFLVWLWFQKSSCSEAALPRMAQASDSLPLVIVFLELKYFLVLSFLGLHRHKISRPLPEMTVMKPYVAKESKDIIVYSLMLLPKGNKKWIPQAIFNFTNASFLCNYLP